MFSQSYKELQKDEIKFATFMTNSAQVVQFKSSQINSLLSKIQTFKILNSSRKTQIRDKKLLSKGSLVGKASIKIPNFPFV